jgi:hypothetical protein
LSQDMYTCTRSRTHDLSHKNQLSSFESSSNMAENPNQLTPVLETKLKYVSEAIVNKAPLCSGTWEIPSESFQLSFRKGDNSAGYVFPLSQVTATTFMSIADGSTC